MKKIIYLLVIAFISAGFTPYEGKSLINNSASHFRGVEYVYFKIFLRNSKNIYFSKVVSISYEEENSAQHKKNLEAAQKRFMNKVIQDYNEALAIRDVMVTRQKHLEEEEDVNTRRLSEIKGDESRLKGISSIIVIP